MFMFFGNYHDRLVLRRRPISEGKNSKVLSIMIEGKIPRLEIFNGWKEIANYMGKEGSEAEHNLLLQG